MLSNVYITTLVLILVMMSSLFLLAQVKKDNSIVDVFWGIGFCIIASILFLLSPHTWERKALLLMMVISWGVRLGLYIFKRNAGKGEDFRYAAWRKEWGKNAAWMAFWKVFMLQGFFMFIISLPILHIMSSPPSAANIWDVLGLLVWLSGFILETVADYQLKVFKSKATNKGKVMDKGCWSISRHPNYFGEILVWWGIFLVSLNADFWYISLISPAVITWLLSNVSGVPMLEKKYLNNPDYQTYIKNVPALIPHWKTIFQIFTKH